MPDRRDLALVVDVSVLCNSGESGEDRHVACRRALQLIGERHRLVWTDELETEWERQTVRPSFSRLWKLDMENRNRIVELIPIPTTEARTAIAALEPTDNRKPVVEKDLHLVEAALATDRVVISSDDNARQHFRRILTESKGSWGVTWSNPGVTKDACHKALESGAFSKTNFR